MTARVLLALTLVLPGLAAAQDAAPVISGLQMNGRKVTQVWLGCVVTILGEGFPADALDGSRPEALKVTLGGSEVMLLVAQAESVTVLIPQFDTPTGRLPLRVTVAGRGSAEVEVEVVAVRFDLPEQPRKQLDPAAEDLLLAAFRITRIVLVRDQTGARFEAEGATPDVIPENFRVGLFLSLGDDRELQSLKVQVKGHAWRATFGPYEGGSPPGATR